VCGSLSNVPRLVVALTLLTVDPNPVVDDDDDDGLRGVVPRKAEEKIGGGGVAWWANIIVLCD